MGFACRAVRAVKSAGPGAAGMQLSKWCATLTLGGDAHAVKMGVRAQQLP